MRAGSFPTQCYHAFHELMGFQFFPVILAQAIQDLCLHSFTMSSKDQLKLLRDINKGKYDDERKQEYKLCLVTLCRITEKCPIFLQESEEISKIIHRA